MGSVTGHCYCKKISFEIQFPTKFISHCHCESCRTSHPPGYCEHHHWTNQIESDYEPNSN
ncbi:MAG: GFA family protein [Bdellovibrio sp.]